MNLYIALNDYNENNIFFYDLVKNNQINNSYYRRINYSIHNLTMNGVFIGFPLEGVRFEKYYDKYKCIYPMTAANEQCVLRIQQLEGQILTRVPIKKTPQYNVYEQMRMCWFKLPPTQPVSGCYFIVLKIQGIWENETDYGVTFKFVQPTGFLGPTHCVGPLGEYNGQSH